MPPTRAAASSTARGTPSSRRQSSAIASAFSVPKWKLESDSWARSTKSRTASVLSNDAVDSWFPATSWKGRREFVRRRSTDPHDS